MEDLVLRRYDAFKRSEEFCSNHTEIFSAGTYGGNLVVGLSEVIRNLTNYFKEQTAQMDAAKSGYSSKAAIKNELYVALKSISKNAVRIDRTIKGIAEKFNLPVKLNEQELLSKARGFAETAAKYEGEFIEHSMKADFLPRLNTIIVAYAEIIDERANATGAHMIATAGIEIEVDKGMDLLDDIEVVVENNYYNDKLIMQTWKAARRVEKARTTSKAEKPPSKPPEAPPAPVSEKP